MTDLFSAWIKLQEDTLALQRAQISTMRDSMALSEQLVDAQRVVQDMLRSGMKAWELWFGLWGVRRS